MGYPPFGRRPHAGNVSANEKKGKTALTARPTPGFFCIFFKISVRTFRTFRTFRDLHIFSCYV